MEKRFEGGTVVKMDETDYRLNCLRVLGNSLPFDSFTIFLKCNKKSPFEIDRFYLLDENFNKTEVSEAHVNVTARNEQVLLIRESQFEITIQSAINDNEAFMRLSKETCEIIYKLGFMTEEQLMSIKYVPNVTNRDC